MSEPSIAFIVTVAHPEHASIRNYASVERMLQIAIATHLAQTSGDANVVVVCHRIPDVARNADARIHFIDVSDSPLFGADRNLVVIDKGMKYLIGTLFAAQRLKPDYVMMVDADDFVAQDLIETIEKQPATPSDGFVLKRGYQALMSLTPERIALSGVFRVKAFDTGCGTCRIFKTSPLLKKFTDFNGEELMRDAFDVSDRTSTFRPKPELLQRVDELALREPFDENLVAGFGRHTAQAPFFKLDEIHIPLAVKGCGHSNHVGPRQGEIHWHRVTKIRNRKAFVQEFGLSGFLSADGPPHITAHVRASWRLFQRRLMRIRNRLRPRS